MKSFYVLKDFFKDNKKQYALGIFWLILTDTLVLIEPKLIKAVTDGLQFKTMTRIDLLKYVAFIIIIYVFIGLGRYMWRVYLMGNSRKLEYYLRKKYYGHIITLPMSFYNENKVGDLITLGTNDIQNVRSAIGQGAVMLFDSLFLLIMGIFMMISTSNTKLTFMTIATFPLVIIIVARFGRIVYHRSRRVQESFSDLSDVTQESFSGIRVIKSFVKEEDNYQKFKDINNENYNRNIHLTKISAFFRPLSQWVLSISYVILIIFGGRMVINGEISIGDFVACNIYLGILSWPTMALGMVINVIQRGAASMDRLNEIFHTHSNILEIDSPIEMHSPKGKVEFENVSFKYPGAKYNALSNINISIEPHNTLGIIGRTGSGKTTLLNLLCRLMDTTEGAIKIDGVDISDIGIHNLRENISYAPQESFLFSETINYNIAFPFDEKIDDSLIEQAAKTANVYDDIMDFPKGFDTILGERGVTLSGGQKQRVSIARALINETPILLIDDSLSAVDTETEDKILSNLKAREELATTIIISHRISTIKHSSEILFMDDGEIIERGTHEELIDLEGQYYSLYMKQLLEDKIKKDDYHGE